MKKSIMENDFLTLYHFKKNITASLYTALSLYVKHEAKISFWDDENFGDTINIICSLNRAIEHLLKLKLLKTDVRKLYKKPNNLIDYCIINDIPYPEELKSFYMNNTNKNLDNKRSEYKKIYFSRTISFSESKKRVEEIIPKKTYDFSNFIAIHNLRNYLEHNWSGEEEEFLKRIIDVMVYKAIPTIKNFITNVLQEDCKEYLDSELLEQMEELNEALKNKHSIATHRRFLEIKKIFEDNPEKCSKINSFVLTYKDLYEIEISGKCPICSSSFYALFDLEADWDYADGESYVAGIYPEVKCLHCKRCCFYIDGIDIKTYFPDLSEIDLGEYFEEDYEEYY